MRRKDYAWVTLGSICDLYNIIYRVCRDKYKWTPQEFDMIDIRRINRIYKELKEDAEKNPQGNIDEDDLERM